MKFLNHKFIVLAVVLLSMSCQTEKKQITATTDYNEYLELVENKTLQTAINDKHFWEKKLEKDPEQFPYLVKLAASHSQLFTITGSVEHLKEAEHLLTEANNITNYENAGYLRSLSRNYISQHRFKEALELLKKAEMVGENLKGTQKMLFDVYLELGAIDQAEYYLSQIEHQSDFDYLIRYSKWLDHEGRLDEAIVAMDRAKVIAESSNNKGLKEWAYTNIADFYGHNGQIKKSYDHYLKALAINPSNAYAKKGIAWIVYSYERNPLEAKRIINSIKNHHNTPDYYLFEAEIADYLGNEASETLNKLTFVMAIDQEAYGDMYNVDKVLLLSEDQTTRDKAKQIAMTEVENRPTALAYDILAWTYYKAENYQQALEIVEQHVYGKTEEPETLLRIAEIYKANGKDDKLKSIKKELEGCIYELGPTSEKQISKL